MISDYEFDLLKNTWLEEDELERISLEFMDPIVEAWKAIYQSDSLSGELVERYKQLTKDCIVHCWGNGATAEMKSGVLIFKHPCGHVVEKLVAF